MKLMASKWLLILILFSFSLATGCSLFNPKPAEVTNTAQPPPDEAPDSPIVASAVTPTAQPTNSPTTTATSSPTASPTTTPTSPPIEPTATEPPLIDPSLDALVMASEDCPTTMPTIASDLASVPSDFPAPVWFYNPNQSIWAGSAPPYHGIWYADFWHKVLWWRQQGSLQVEGSRLDGTAPPLETEISAGYGNEGIQASGLFFPTPGCWEVVAQAEQETLRFVVYVYPLEYAPANSPYEHQDAETLAELVQAMDAIVLGEVAASSPFGKDFHRQTLRLVQAWKGEFVADGQIVVLQEQSPYLQRLEIGQQYLLILEQRPNNLWRIAREYRSVGHVVDGNVQTLQQGQWQLWHGESLAEIDQDLRDLLDP